MATIDDLRPTEADLAGAYVRLLSAHEARTVYIANTGLHPCLICDEVWPCDVAVLLAGFRDFRQQAKKLAEITLTLSGIACAAAEIIVGMKADSLSTPQKEELYLRLTAAIEVMKRREDNA